MLTFTCRKTSNILVWLTEFFFFGEPVGMEGVNCSSPLPFLLTVLPLAVQLLWELSWLELGLLVSVLYTSQSHRCLDFINSYIWIIG